MYFSIFWSLLIFGICYFFYKFLIHSIEKIASRAGKKIKAPKTLSMVIGFLIYGFGIAIILSIWNVNLIPYLTGLGISGIVLGLAFQEPLTNFLSGLLVVVTRKVFEGEIVDINGITGVVDIVEMNHTRIKTFDGKLILIPNRNVWSGTVTKLWADSYRRVSFDITVDYKSNLEKVIELLKKAIEDDPYVVKNESLTNFVVFKEFGSSGVTYTINFWVSKDTYFEAINSLSIRIKNYFDEFGVSIPFTIIELRRVSS